MRVVQYLLTPFGNRWRVLEDGYPLGRLDERAQAEQAIAAMTRVSVAAGYTVETLETNQRGEMRSLDFKISHA